LAGASRTTALDKSLYFEYPHVVVQRYRNHVPGPYETARSIDLGSIDPDVAGVGQRHSGVAGTDDAGMPEPTVDALAIRICGFFTERIVSDDRVPPFRIR
jgi:hypothetical protein